MNNGKRQFRESLIIFRFSLLGSKILPTANHLTPSRQKSCSGRLSARTQSTMNMKARRPNSTRKHGCTLEQLNWRRSTIRNECDGDLDKFHQEYPSTPEEAFLVSGRPRFNVKILKKMLSVSSPPKMVGYLVNGLQGPELELNQKGYLKIWAAPLTGRKYVIGGDVAEGHIQREDTKEPDYSCLQVLDRKTLEQVAVLAWSH